MTYEGEVISQCRQPVPEIKLLLPLPSVVSQNTQQFYANCYKGAHGAEAAGRIGLLCKVLHSMCCLH